MNRKNICMSAVAILALAGFAVAQQFPQAEIEALAAAIISTSRPTLVEPAPSPGPSSGECENCAGTGKLGDGTITLTCTVCNGTGKKVNSKPQAEPDPVVSEPDRSEATVVDDTPAPAARVDPARGAAAPVAKPARRLFRRRN
jgi:hypothetical protein